MLITKHSINTWMLNILNMLQVNAIKKISIPIKINILADSLSLYCVPHTFILYEPMK